MNSFWKKLGSGLKKTSDKLTAGITDIFNKRPLDGDVLENLEEILLEADTGIKAATEIIQDFAARKQNKNLDEKQIREFLAQDIEKILLPVQHPFETDAKQTPYVILMVGVNGAGKTTTIGKLAARLQNEGKQVSFIAADTFRAAAVEQLKIWAERLNINVFSGADGCDSAGLCYDGLNAARKNGDDVVFIDTAGRLQNKTDLMEELKKIVRVIQKIMPDAPHKILLTLDAATGQNAVSQVKIFKQTVGVNGLIVTKLDGTSKGGILLAIAKETALPVYFIGVGEKIDELDTFNARDYSRRLLNL